MHVHAHTYMYVRARVFVHTPMGVLGVYVYSVGFLSCLFVRDFHKQPGGEGRCSMSHHVGNSPWVPLLQKEDLGCRFTREFIASLRMCHDRNVLCFILVFRMKIWFLRILLARI